MLDALPLAIAASLLLYAAASDVASMTIPNWVSIALAGAFPIVALAQDAPLTLIGLHLGFGVLMLGVGFLLFQAGVFGGGDAKLIAAAAVWTGLGAFTAFALFTTLSGGLLALSLLIARKYAKPDPARPAFLNRLLQPKGGVPYGVAIAIGGLAALGLGADPGAAHALTTP